MESPKGGKRSQQTPYLSLFFIILTACWFFIVVQGCLTEPPVPWSEDGGKADSHTHTDANGHLFDLAAVASPPEREGEEVHPSEHKQESDRRDALRRTDLAAQRGMWRATNTLVYLTIFQVFIGVVGVLLIFYTLKETRDVLEEAKKTTQSQRAYVWQSNNIIVKGFSNESIQVGVGIKNYGATPALYVQVLAGCSVVAVGEPDPTRIDVTNEDIVGREFMPPRAETVYSRVITDKGAHHRFIHQMADIVFVARVTYRDIYGAPNEYGDIAVRIRYESPGVDSGAVRLKHLACSTRPTVGGEYRKHSGKKD